MNSMPRKSAAATKKVAPKPKEVVEDVSEEVQEPVAEPPAPAKKAPAKKAATKKAPAKKTGATTEKKAPAKRATSTKTVGVRQFRILIDSVRPPIDPSTFSKNGGSYEGKDPRRAAGRAFTQLARKGAGGGECEYIFTILETTKGRENNGEHTYIGTRTKLEVPRPIKRSGAEYSSKYDNKIKAYKPEAGEDAPAKKAPAKKAPAKKAPAKKAPAKKAPAKKVEEPDEEEEELEDEPEEELEDEPEEEEDVELEEEEEDEELEE